MGTFDGVITPGTNQDAVHVRLLELFGNDIGEVSAPLEMVMAWAVSYVNSQPQPYTAQQYIEARRWQEQQNTSLILDTGRLSPTEYAKIVVSSYEDWQRILKLRLSLLAQAKSIEEIEAILGRL